MIRYSCCRASLSCNGSSVDPPTNTGWLIGNRRVVLNCCTTTLSLSNLATLLKSTGAGCSDFGRMTMLCTSRAASRNVGSDRATR